MLFMHFTIILNKLKKLEQLLRIEYLIVVSNVKITKMINIFLSII